MNPLTHVSDKWMERANCVGTDPEAFFPEFREQTSRTVRMICRECPVARECLSYALRNDIRDGLFGGVEPVNRQRLHVLYNKILQEQDPIRLERAFEELLDKGSLMNGRY
jgi:WhiB family redox-sensing transcriptional regulator